nr:MAG TPA: Helix-turn-helix XRE-family like protein [Caudoviricetes sp.]
MNRLKECREKANLTQSELAKKSGLTRSYINKIENSNKASKKVKIQTLLKISECLNKSPIEVWGTDLLKYEPQNIFERDKMIQILEDYYNVQG